MKFFLKIFIFVLPLSEAYAEGQNSAGLPQMDISTFPSQLFWLIVTFTALYLFMWKFVIPRLSTTIEERKDKISNDINDAENLNSEASKILENYDDKMSSASLESNEILSTAILVSPLTSSILTPYIISLSNLILIVKQSFVLY